MKRYLILILFLLTAIAAACTAQGSATVAPQTATSGAAMNNEDEMAVPMVEASGEMTDEMSEAATAEDTAGDMTDDMQGEMDGEKSAGMSDASTEEMSDGAAGEEIDETMSDNVNEAASDTEHAMDDGTMSSGGMDDASGKTGASVTDDAGMTGTDVSAHEITLAPWQTLPLVNARTGETFMLSDFAGKTVFVEPMATWCTNCRRQLNNILSVRAGLNSDEVVFVALSVETNISAAELAQYADGNGFDWVFAVMSPEILQSLTDTFGRTITNPPSTPHFIVRPDGRVTELFTGIRSPEDITAVLGG